MGNQQLDWQFVGRAEDGDAGRRLIVSAADAVEPAVVIAAPDGPVTLTAEQAEEAILLARKAVAVVLTLRAVAGAHQLERKLAEEDAQEGVQPA